MPLKYYHYKCGGRISILRRRCKKCGKKWPLNVLWQYPLPFDIAMTATERRKILKKGTTSYARWADKYPYVGEFASRLPKWPRWARILSAILVLGVLGYLLHLLWGLFR